MNLNDYIERAKRVLMGLACIAFSIFLVHRGNSTGDFTVVPVMCVFTAFALSATGLTMMAGIGRAR